MATAMKPLAGLGKRVTTPQTTSTYTQPTISKATPAQIEAAQKREAYDKALAADISKVEQWDVENTPITTWQQAQKFYQSDLAKIMPIETEIANLNWSISTADAYGQDRNANGYVREDIAKAEAIRKNPLSYVKKNFPRLVSLAAFTDFPELASRHKSNLDKAVAYLIQNKVDVKEIQKLADSGMAEAQQRYQHNVSASKPDFMDYVFGAAENLIVGGLTGGLGLSAVNSAALNSALAIANGANVQDALKAGIAGLAANEVGSYLQSVNSLAANPTVNTAVTNAARNIASASVLGQDVKTAALAGLAGGAAAGTLLKASDNAAISRAVGEYTQGIASGMSPAMAMTQALSGFADEEMADARRKIQDQAAIEQAKIDTKKPAQDQVIEAFSQPKSPGVGTQLGEATAELGGGIQYGSRPGAQGTDIVSDVNLPSIPVKPVIPSDVNTLPTVEVVASPGEFGADLIRPTTPSRDTDILNLTGLRPAITPPSGVSVTTPTLPDITIPTAPTQPIAPPPPTQPTQPTQPSAPVTPPAPTQPPATDQMLPEVEVTGDRDRDILNLTGLTRPTTPTTPTTPQAPPKPSLPEVEVVGEPLEEEPVELKPDTEAETKPTKPPVEEEPGTKPTRPILLSLLNLPTAYLGDRPGEMRPGTAALAQALGVGDPGALYLGKKGKERKPVWNVESLKLKDELGGDYG